MVEVVGGGRWGMGAGVVAEATKRPVWWAALTDVQSINGLLQFVREGVEL